MVSQSYSLHPSGWTYFARSIRPFSSRPQPNRSALTWVATTPISARQTPVWCPATCAWERTTFFNCWRITAATTAWRYPSRWVWSATPTWVSLPSLTRWNGHVQWAFHQLQVSRGLFRFGKEEEMKNRKFKSIATFRCWIAPALSSTATIAATCYETALMCM